MRNIQLIFKKEDIEPEQMKGKVAVVFDILFATTTITAALEDGAESVFAVYDQAQAREKARSLDEDSYVLAGEEQGRTIDGFYHPLRTYLNPIVKGKHLILSTTNGTVAINRSSQAEHLYTSSLLNNREMAKHLVEQHKGDQTIVLVCSGTSGHFTMEDFYGAGSLLSYLVEKETFNLSDAAQTALQFYNGLSLSPYELLRSTKIGNILLDFGMHERELKFAAQEGSLHTICKYDQDSRQIKEVE
ncbi:2-phosphosulfolactate phosphatase [Halobacillus sp. A1]|uniref:2-phosphosulfolactate phosphatase n=1 Tax=Halobacillus sp. A1 TaxID=2880262 RepID=UPI0020A6A71C|nr:2-phosphosulfolactate phosphatase [Halobacillus sp. A1]MCP3030148.1 2-phosphosulfolactate phosphatase [Halobacillus sp. A1]